MKASLLFRFVTVLVVGTALRALAAGSDFAQAVVVIPPGLSGPERKAATMLIEEVEKRSYQRWALSEQEPASGPVVYLGQRTALAQRFPRASAALPAAPVGAEGYAIAAEGQRIVVAGNDARGVLFGAGRLLRALHYGRESVTLPDALRISTAPRYRLRGHQLGYRPKTNSYDGWTVADWENYIRDLVAYGANAIEIIPPRSDDDADSPHFNLSPMRMMVELSRLAQDYGIELWIWYPALDKDYGDPKQVEFALREWGEVLRQLPKVDALFVPGGDPGHTPPRLMFALLERQAKQLRQLHPNARVWMSPQGFNQAWMDDFKALMNPRPAWLEGIVFGPQQRVSVEELRAMLPAGTPIRFYPDITHTINCQYPVPQWDPAFQATLNREPINPRPLDEAAIFHRLQPANDYGVLTYSEGCNDDVNKCIWSQLAWAPETDVRAILRDYSSYFIGANLADPLTEGLLALERNWRGPLATNDGVEETLARFQSMERAATPAQLRNWRFQQLLYRAYYDATIRARLRDETAREEGALSELQRATSVGSLAAIAAAEQRLAGPGAGAALRARVFELAEALFQSIHMQLSVPRYRAIAVGRGANLDLIDAPLTNAPWLQEQFSALKKLTSEDARRQGIARLLTREDPGAGGYYDDLGQPGAQPHLVAGTAYADDPAMLRAPHWANSTSRSGPAHPRASRTYAEARDDQPLEMLYRGLDPKARYRVRIVYGLGDLGTRENPMTIRLVANQRHEIHGFRPKDPTGQPVEFAVPPEATQGGELRLTWSRPAGLGGNGRGVQVAEVWLLRDAAPTAAAAR